MPVIEIRPSFTLTAGIALVCGAAALAGCDRQSEAPEQPQAEAGAVEAGGKTKESAFNGVLDIAARGQDLPDVTVSLPDGTEKSLTAFRGKPVLLNLWATWCGPCVLEMPTLDELAARHAGKLQVITVSQDLRGTADIEQWFNEKGYQNLEPWMEPDAELAFDFGGTLPTTVLYDAQGKEVWRMIGGHDWSGARTEAMLADTLDAVPAKAD